MLDPKTEKFAKELFVEYYSKVDAELIAPPNIERREFGFGDFEKKISYRHFSFANPGELRSYMVENSPPFVSYSSAEYEKPSARPMENKIWKGSELIFDLDATDMHLKCQEEHGRSWVCGNCLDSIKNETIRLVEDFLLPDFGFPMSEISMNFSGNRGYHVHVADQSVFGLDSKARRSISEYIAGIGINPISFFPAMGQRGAVLRGPKPMDAGWGGKFAKGMITAMNEGEESLANLGIERALARRFVRNKADIMLGIGNGNWDRIKIPRKAEFWATVIKNMAIKQSDSIDKNVTNDTHHLLRLPNTIHGDTGLVGRKISSIGELASFEPMRDAIAYKGKSIKIHVSKAPAFVMNDETYGPYENRDVELPVYASLYLLLKRTAILK